MEAHPQAKAREKEPGAGRAPAAFAWGSPEAVLAMTAGIAKGDERAFDRFYAVFFDRLHRYLLYRSGGWEEGVRDALQETMLRVIRHMRPFREGADLWNWLRRIASSALVDQVRKERRRPLPLLRIPESGAAVASDEDPDAALEEILSGCLDALAPEQRALIEGKYFEGSSVAALALQAGVTEKAVESKLARIRKKLKAMILERLDDE